MSLITSLASSAGVRLLALGISLPTAAGLLSMALCRFNASNTGEILNFDREYRCVLLICAVGGEYLIAESKYDPSILPSASD